MVKRAAPSPEISIPEAESDRPRLGRLGAIAILCFAAGLAWPELLGRSLIQRPPGSDKKDEQREREVAPERDPEFGAPPKSEPKARAVPVARMAPLATASIGSTVVVSCRTGAGRRLSNCDEPNVLAVLTAPIEGLVYCDAAEGASGVLSLGLELDFGRGYVMRAKSGQSTTLPRAQAAALIECAESQVVGTRIAGAAHDHASYWVYYMVQFAPPGAAGDGPQIIPASGHGTIGWKTAVVRGEPSRQGKILAQLLYGTRITVSGRVGDWYRIDYDGRGSSGWVHRKALGL